MKKSITFIEIHICNQTVSLCMHPVPDFTFIFLAFFSFCIFFLYISKEMFYPREKKCFIDTLFEKGGKPEQTTDLNRNLNTF